MRDDLPGQRHAHHEGADRGRDVEPSGDAGDEQGAAEQRQEQRFAGLAQGDGAEAVAEQIGHGEHRQHRRQRHHHSHGGAERRAAEDHPGDDRQVEHHGEVLNHEDAEHHGRLVIADSVQVGDQLRHDARRGDVGHPAEQDRDNWIEVKNQPGDESGREVQDEIDDSRQRRPAHIDDEFAHRKLQPQHQQHEDEADLGSGFDELRRRRQLDEAALAESQPREQVQRKRRYADPPGQASNDGQAQDDRAELDDQQVAARVHGLGLSGGRSGEQLGRGLHRRGDPDHHGGVARFEPLLAAGDGDRA